MSSLRPLFHAVALSLIAGSALAHSLKPVISVEGITEYRLPNGLQVLLVPDESKPSTTVNVTYRVGSMHENYGETGMAHLLEHLIFKGSPKFEDPWKEFTKRGFRANGSTWLDRTNYFASFAANDANLKWYLQWQADAMVNSYIARKHLDSEMTVVRNEMERGENDPWRITIERTLATQYQWHNYGKSTIGARADVENVDITRLQGFYRTYYQPDNATLIVSGKFKPDQVLDWVEDSFGKIKKPARKLPALYTLDPVQDGERSVTVRRVGGNPLAVASYHVTPGTHPDAAAVAALSSILVDNPTGRLYKRLVVEKKLASTVESFSPALAEPGFAMLMAEAAPGVQADALQRELLDVVEGFGREPVTAEELKRAQTTLLNAWEKGFNNPEHVGVELSESIAVGDWKFYFLERDRIKALKLEDVQRVATERFLPDNRTAAQYLPTEKPVRAPQPEAAKVAEALKSFKPQAAAAAVAAFDATPANIDARTQISTLPNGLQLALLPKPTRGEAVQGSIALRFGSAQSLQGQAAAGALLASMLDMGTATLSRAQLKDALDAAKVQWTAGGSAEGVTLRFSTTREHAARALELLSDMLRQPRLDAAGLAEVVSQQVAGITAQKDDPQGVASQALSKVAASPYPAGHVKAFRSFEEQIADFKAVTLEQVQRLHQQQWGAQAGQVALVGDFDAKAVQAVLTQKLGDWKANVAYERIASKTHGLPGQKQLLATPDKQNAMLLGALELPVTDDEADVPALLLANHIFGSGGASRLWVRIREKDGLSYGVGSQLSLNPRDKASALMLYAIFAPQNRAKVEAALREETARALKDGFTAEELAQAKQALLSQRKLSLAQDTGVAARWTSNLQLQRRFERDQRISDAIEKQSLEQVNAALRKYLSLDKAQLFFAGDFK
ncbi:M16 family metallopeptidase [Roseateles sp. BYS180W]|uniref:M16 family metallopeptidase n=1 Tax=Roseateles rivi TaxID=3299028 RepID=A0ABW7FWQ6_9BURK